MQGKYIFGDFVQKKILALNFNRDTDPTTFNGSTAGISNVSDLTASLNATIAGKSLNAIVSFGEDNSGNLYIIDFTDPTGGNIFNPALGHGEIYEIVATPEPTLLGMSVLAGVLLMRRTRK